MSTAAKLELTESEAEAAAELASLNRPRPLGSLTAAGRLITSKKIENRPGQGRATVNAWQDDAWDMYDLVGEQRFLSSTLADRMSQARFFVGKRPKDTTEDVEPVKDGPAYEVFDAMHSKAGFSQHIKRMGVNLFVPGEGFLLGVPEDHSSEVTDGPKEDVKTDAPLRQITPLGKAPDEDPLEEIDITKLRWSMHSGSELVLDGTAKTVTVRGGLGKGRVHNLDAVMLLQVWRPHPRFWDYADSPTRSSLPVLRELVGLTMHISAQIDSRLAGAGWLVIPASADEAAKAQQGKTDGEDSADEVSPFATDLMEAMITPIGDRSSASAVVPLVSVMPDEAIDKIKFFSFAVPLDAEARNLREESIRRLALGQDCPPELLLGTSGMNHWGAWLVREDVVTTHLEPPLALICDALTTQYLWPILEQQAVADFEDYVIWYDVNHLIVRPNRSAEAEQGHKAGVISDSTYRDALGFDENDAPEVDPTDNVTKLILDMIREAPSLLQTPGLAAIAEQVRALVEGSDIPPNPPSQRVTESGPIPNDQAVPAPNEPKDGPPATSEDPAPEPGGSK